MDSAPPTTGADLNDKAATRALPMALIVLGAVVGVASVLALWVKRQALETDTWAETSTELLEDATIRDAVGDFTVAALFDNVDVEAELGTRLSPQLEPLAGPAAGGLRQLADRAADEALSRPKAQAAWEDANRRAHERLLMLVDDEGEFVATTGGTVTLDLTGLVAQVAAEAGLGADVASRLPGEASELEIMRADQLDAARGGVKILRTLAWVLTALSLALFALAIYVARGRRRAMLRAVGFAFIAVGLVAVVARNAGGNALAGALTTTAAAEAPVESTWEIGTSLLRDTTQSIVVYGFVILLAAWLGGPSRAATGVRGFLAPYLRRPAGAYGGLALGLIVLFWWNPVVATDRLLPSLLVIAILGIGVEALRRQTAREFPDRTVATSPAGLAHAAAARLRDARRRSEPASAAPDEGRLDALERLQRLRESGLLSDDELAAEKRRILQPPASSG